MQQQTQEMVGRVYTDYDRTRLENFVIPALNRVLQCHTKRWPRTVPELYKIFINGKAQLRLNLPKNHEQWFEFLGKRALLYTSKPEENISICYVTCEILKRDREKGKQTILYLDVPPPIETPCIIK